MWFVVSLLSGVCEIHIMKIGFRHGRYFLMSPNKDKTGNERQQRRRQREKEWLKEHGFKSWEAVHTILMNTEIDKLVDMYVASRKKQFEILSKEIVARNAYIAGFLSFKDETSLTQRGADGEESGAK